MICKNENPNGSVFEVNFKTILGILNYLQELILFCYCDIKYKVYLCEGWVTITVYVFIYAL